MKPVIDPRCGDVEDDASSTKRLSLLSLAGSLLAEISLPKLAVAWFLLIVGPGLVLGVAPVVAAIWVSKLSTRLEYPIAGIWPLVILDVAAARIDDRLQAVPPKPCSGCDVPCAANLTHSAKVRTPER